MSAGQQEQKEKEEEEELGAYRSYIRKKKIGGSRPIRRIHPCMKIRRAAKLFL